MATRNRRIRIQRRAESVDAAGQPMSGWEDAMPPLWANIAGPTGLGVIASGEQGVSAAIGRYSIRIMAFRDDIDIGMRVLHGASAFDIRDVRPDFDRRRHTDLVCQLGGSDG